MVSRKYNSRKGRMARKIEESKRASGARAKFAHPTRGGYCHADFTISADILFPELLIQLAESERPNTIYLDFDTFSGLRSPRSDVLETLRQATKYIEVGRFAKHVKRFIRELKAVRGKLEELLSMENVRVVPGAREQASSFAEELKKLAKRRVNIGPNKRIFMDYASGIRDLWYANGESPEEDRATGEQVMTVESILTDKGYDHLTAPNPLAIRNLARQIVCGAVSGRDQIIISNLGNLPSAVEELHRTVKENPQLLTDSNGESPNRFQARVCRYSDPSEKLGLIRTAVFDNFPTLNEEFEGSLTAPPRYELFN